MFRHLNTNKTIQAIGVLLRSERSKSMGRLRILKLLYIAEREMLKETGRALLGCRVVAMDHGPLHSEVLDLLKGQHFDEPKFSAHFDRAGYAVQLVADPGVLELSRFEIAKLQDLCAKYSDLDDGELAHGVTHKFEEWAKAYHPGTSTTISLESILAAVGRAEDTQEIIQDEQDRASFESLFSDSK